jgi:hypothetical protein
MLAQNCTFICVSIAIRTKIGNNICNWLLNNTANGRNDNICDSIDLKDYICSPSQGNAECCLHGRLTWTDSIFFADFHNVVQKIAYV